MKLYCQEHPLEVLKRLADGNRQSVLIEGPQGCGKNYLARQYANMLFISDVQEVAPDVNQIRATIEECYKIDNPVMIIVNNLDIAQNKSPSYALLKFLEEPMKDVYIVITCRNINRLPSTIPSRCTVVSCSGPTELDISGYAANKDVAKFNYLQKSRLWKCVKSFGDVETVFAMNQHHYQYFGGLKNLIQCSKPIEDMLWDLQYYPAPPGGKKEETPIELVIRYITKLVPTKHVQRIGVECITNLNSSVPKHVTLAKFLLELKYLM